MAANLTWILLNVDDAPRHHVFNSECADYMPPNVPERHATTIGTLVQWIAEQPSSIESETASLKPAFVRTTDSGLKTYDQPNGPRIYVPIGRRRHLFNFVHKTINHMAATMTLNELKKS